jgi:acetyltransferase-like isoleucine patch superfamily enzyme
MVEAFSNKIIAMAWHGSVVNGMFLDRVVVGGVPAKMLRELNNVE